ncbi:alpha/beta hydrolase fold domain-containing protein [Mycolicibacterium sp. GCM10028919]|uniref:alpha/beta hydrolase fold domain-containing protein n=1 Tax=Mycolicibacterium sp. GCM10028919 TaxID=3273401 RepID=UPI00360C1A02
MGSHVGRVGAIAVGLGIGAAVAAGWSAPQASADADGGTSASSESSADSSSDSSTESSSPSSKADAASGSAAPSKDTTSSPDTKDDDAAATDTDEDTEKSATTARERKPQLKKNDEEEQPEAVEPADLESVTATEPDPAPAVPASAPTRPVDDPSPSTVPALTRRDTDRTSVSPPIEPASPPITSGAPPADLAAAALPPADQRLYTGTPSLVSQVVTLGLRVVDVVLRPFGGILAFTSLDIPIFTDGVPPFFLTHGLHVQRSDFEGTPVWTLRPASSTEKVIVGLHGGAYVAEASLFHWWTYTDMARDTGATVVVPLYPLLPEGNAAEVVPDTADFISAMISQHGAENVSVIGDSAGGGLALAATQELVRRGSPVPSRMVLLAPWLDATVSDPRSAAIDGDDPLLDVPSLRDDGSQWAGSLGADHPYASPLNGSLDGLPPTAVFSGSLDLLTPDSLRLRQRTIDEGLTNFSFDFRNGMIHDWPIFAFLPDAIGIRPAINRALLG